MSEDDIKLLFSHNLAKMLTARAWSTTEFSRKLGKGESTVRQWVDGGAMPTAKLMSLIVKTLDIHVGSLFAPPGELPVRAKIGPTSDGSSAVAATLLAGNINSLLASKGVNANQLAASLGLPPSTVYSWTAGKSSPQVAKLDGIAAFFGVPISELFRTGKAGSSVDSDAFRLLVEGLSELGLALEKTRSAQKALAVSSGIPVPRTRIGGDKAFDETRPLAAGQEGKNGGTEVD